MVFEFKEGALVWYFLERLTELVKMQLKIHLSNAKLSIDELQIILLEIEIILNKQCLTPNHLLCICRLEPHSLVENPKFRPSDIFQTPNRFTYSLLAPLENRVFIRIKRIS